MRSSRSLPIVPVVLVAILLLAHAIAAPRNHDEAQYAAAAALSGKLLIFRDFISLQTPLLAWLYAPLVMVFAGHALIAMRLATAMTAMLTLLIVYDAQRRRDVAARDAGIATLLLACCAPFLFAASVIRNDMLPTALCAAAIWLWSLGCGPARSLLAGMCLGLAASAKISFAPQALAPLAVLLVATGGGSRRTAAWYLAGLAIGLLPIAFVAAVAPAAVRYGVVTFGASAPFAWYSLSGAEAALTPAAKIVDCIKVLAIGPAAVAMLLVFAPRSAFARRAALARDRLLLALLIGGLIGLLVPTPTHLQYAMPVLPPLFVLLGHRLDEMRAGSGRRLALALLSASAGLGIACAARGLLHRGARGPGMMAITAQAHLIGRILDSDGRGGALATLSPDLVIDSGHPIDPRFATGPFVYRSGTLVDPALARRLNMATPTTLAGDLDERPPLALLTGSERRVGRLRLDLETGIVAYARSRAYRAVMLPGGTATLWLRPRRMIAFSGQVR